MLVGRGAEQREIDRLLDAAGKGQSGTLVIHGDAGVGKSALLEYAQERAGALRRIRSQGFSSETDLPFSGLSDLLRPLSHMIPALPAAQGRALASALALGPPVPGDRFAVSAGTLSLLAAAADEGPLLATVDDLQWVDASSVEAIVFAARRLHAEGIVMLLGVREPAGQVPAGLPEIHLDGLEPAEALSLLRLRSGQPVDPDVARELLVATRGYPLPIVELATLLSPEQLKGLQPLPDPLPAGKSMEQWYRRQLAAFPPGTQRLLLVLATLDSSTPGILGTVSARLGLDSSALDEAERAGLLQSDGGTPVFRHPLIRSAVYLAATPGDRRSIHASISEALTDIDPERRAWHRARAATGPDEGVATELEEVARQAELRSGFPAAARGLERAAELSETLTSRTRRLYGAAEAWNRAGRWLRALALLDRVDAGGDSLLKARLEFLRGQIELWTGRSSDAVRRLSEAARSVEVAQPGVAVEMLCVAATGCFMAAAVDRALEIGEAAFRTASGKGDAAEGTAAITLAEAYLLKGEFARTRELLATAQGAMTRLPPQAALLLTPFLFFTLLNLEDYEQARTVAERFVQTLRSLSAPSLLPYTLAVQCELEFRTGRWNAALAVGSESVRLAEELGQTSGLAYSLICLARVEAGIGAEPECRSHAELALQQAATYGNRSIEHYAAAVLGFLELGLRRLPEATKQLRLMSALQAETKLEAPSVVMSQPDAVEALAQNGNLEEATAFLVILERQAQKTGSRWATGAAARCRGILAGAGDYDDHFARSLTLLVEMPFEEARTSLCYGEKLLAGRRRNDARERLRAALVTFERLGAEPWAARAHSELARLGDRRSTPQGPVARRLTNQELQISLMVADGATNQEVATRLFLSRKTVEAHLTAVYGKLGVRSRTELSRLLLRESPGLLVSQAPALPP